jgi:hypothetical protein
MGETMTRDELLDLAGHAAQGKRKQIDRLKVIANAAGYVGRLGGWIVSPSGFPMAHGWRTFAEQITTGLHSDGKRVERLIAAANAASATEPAPRVRTPRTAEQAWRQVEPGSYEHVATGATVTRLDSKRWRAYEPNHSWQDALPMVIVTRDSKKDALAAAEQWIANVWPQRIAKAYDAAYAEQWQRDADDRAARLLPDFAVRTEHGEPITRWNFLTLDQQHEQALLEADARHPSRARWDELVSTAYDNGAYANPERRALDQLHGEALRKGGRDMLTGVANMSAPRVQLPQTRPLAEFRDLGRQIGRMAQRVVDSTAANRQVVNSAAMYGVRVLRPGGEPEFVVVNSTALTEVPHTGVMVQLFGALIDREPAHRLSGVDAAGYERRGQVAALRAAQYALQCDLRDPAGAIDVIAAVAKHLGVTL